ncbi:MAG: 1-acyl-sn-glycerol-3-phosphate acyltransferase [Clostridia bacterium]|nr:1-acyl-sn-glycerol-3-phosphate acyltransferase [Clostridia bacterium]
MGLQFYKVAKSVTRGFLKIFYPYEVENENSIPDGMPCVICSNHLSNIDPVLINATQAQLMHFMAKQELFKNKLFGALIRKLGAFPVNRGSDGGKAINTAEELLKKGECIGIFIEGTRSKTGKLGRGHMGAIVIAHAAGVPIVPCCITGKNIFVKPFRKTRITYGEPITCEELGIVTGESRELRAAAKLVMAKIGEMRAHHEEQFGISSSDEGDK